MKDSIVVFADALGTSAATSDKKKATEFLKRLKNAYEIR